MGQKQNQYARKDGMAETAENTTTKLTLLGLDGANPLAFLAALGTLRTATRAFPDHRVTMSWQVRGGAYRPTLYLNAPVDQTRFNDALHQQLRCMSDHPAFAFDHDLNIKPEPFAEHVDQAAASAHDKADREWTDFAAAFGCETLTDDNGAIQNTALRTMSGAGHQHFLTFVRILVDQTKPEELDRALFQPWDYADPGPTLRWDPADDRRYAWRWTNPSGDPGTTMRGANRLAVEALPLLPTMPRANQLETTGFTGTNSRNTYLRWPIWKVYIPLEVCQTLIALSALHDTRIPRDRLQAMGVADVFQSQRITVGNFRNFTPGQAAS
jgi:hypothetical protein